jgi:hypothetical protein
VLTKENKLLLIVYICSKLTEVCHSISRLKQKNASGYFPLVPFSVFGIPATWQQIQMENGSPGYTGIH